MDSESTRLLSLIWTTKSLSIVAIIFQFLEFSSQLIDEIEYLWRGRIRLISYLYAWARYFPLISQMWVPSKLPKELLPTPFMLSSVIFVLAERTHRSLSPENCLSTFIVKGISAQLTATCVEAILMIRGNTVHALYSCSVRSGQLLAGTFVVGTILEVLGTFLTIFHLEPGIDGSICFPARCSYRGVALFVSGCLVTQGTLLAMTLFKIFSNRSTARWLRTPIISLMLRDGISYFVLLAVVLASICSFEFLRSLGSRDAVFLWNVAYTWYISLISISGCRMIINMRKLKVGRSQTRQLPGDPACSLLTQFSTIIDIDDTRISDASVFDLCTRSRLTVDS